jgi:hypothetical protein
MSNKRMIYGAMVSAKLLISLYLILMGLMVASAAAETGKPAVFTHAVFAEFGTATW